MTISARQLTDGMIRRDISPRELSIQKGMTESTIRKWMKGGVPKKHEHDMREYLIATEKKVHGGHQMDMFPTKDDVL